jgi:hypothetical protein
MKKFIPNGIRLWEKAEKILVPLGCPGIILN